MYFVISGHGWLLEDFPFIREISWCLESLLQNVSYSLYIYLFFLFFPENLVSGLHLNDSLGKHYISLSPKPFMKISDPVILKTILGAPEKQLFKYWYLDHKLIPILP